MFFWKKILLYMTQWPNISIPRNTFSGRNIQQTVEWGHKDMLKKARALFHLMKMFPITEGDSTLSTSAVYLGSSTSHTSWLFFQFPVFWFSLFGLHSVVLLLILSVAVGINFHMDMQVPLTHLLMNKEIRTSLFPKAPETYTSAPWGAEIWAPKISMVTHFFMA